MTLSRKVLQSASRTIWNHLGWLCIGVPNFRRAIVVTFSNAPQNCYPWLVLLDAPSEKSNCHCFWQGYWILQCTHLSEPFRVWFG